MDTIGVLPCDCHQRVNINSNTRVYTRHPLVEKLLSNIDDAHTQNKSTSRNAKTPGCQFPIVYFSHIHMFAILCRCL